MDMKVLLDVLKHVGLPGAVIFGWIAAALTGNDSHEDLLLWGEALVAAIFVNFVIFQLKEWQNSIITALQGMVQDIQIRNTETLETLATNQHHMVVNLAHVMAAQEGKLTLGHIRMLVVYLCDAFKWRTWQVCLSAIDSKTLAVVDRSSLQQAVELQIQSLLKNVSQYNQVMARSDIKGIANEAVSTVFDTLYDPDFIANENISYQVKTITCKIQDAFSEVVIKMGACIDKQRESNELDVLLKNL